MPHPGPVLIDLDGAEVIKYSAWWDIALLLAARLPSSRSDYLQVETVGLAEAGPMPHIHNTAAIR